MRTNFYMDEDSMRGVGELPRKFNASKIVRFCIKALTLTDAEWDRYWQADEDAKAIRAYIRKKGLNRF